MNRPGQVDQASEQRVSLAPSRPRQRSTSRKLAFTVVLLTAAVVLMIFGARFLLHRLAYVQETDARIVADVTLISSRVSGRLVSFTASEGAAIAQGDIIGRLDDRMAKAEMRELKSRLETTLAEQERIEAETVLVRTQARRRVDSERSKLTAAKALYDSYKLEFRLTKDDFERAERLSKTGVIPRTRLEQARTDYNKAQQAMLRARAQIATAEAELGVAEAEIRRVDVLRRELVVLGFQASQIQAQIQAKKVEIEDALILSPIAGVINRTFVNPGEYVNAGQRIALIHNPDSIWIEALIKETEIRRLALGQTVNIHVDAYPDRAFTGEVMRLGHATTSEFSLLPSPNPSGNFTKVTQRLPVRIAIDQVDGLLKPGMMVEVAIDVRGR